MKNKFVVGVSIIFTLAVHSCRSQSQTGSVVMKGPCVAYIQARAGKLTSADEFGDVFVCELESGRTARLTDDRFYDRDPAVSPDGKQVAFVSNRVGSSLELAVKGINSPHELYLYDLPSGSLRRIGETAEQKYPKIMRGHYGSLQWTSDGKSLIFENPANQICQYSLEADSAWELSSIDSGAVEKMWLPHFTLSPDMRTVAFTAGEQFEMMGFYDRQTKDFAWADMPSITDSGYMPFPVLGGWRQDNNSVLVINDEKLYSVDKGTGNISRVIRDTSIAVSLGGAHYVGDSAVVFLGMKKDAQSAQTYTKEVMMYNMRTHQCRRVTHDNAYKDELSASTR